MDCPQPLLKGGGPHHRRAHHIGARDQIITGTIGMRQIFDHQPHSLKRYALAHRVIMRAGIGLDTMRKGIKPGSGRDEIRHANGEFRIADHDRRQHFGVKDDLLHMADRIGDHRGAPHFRPGSSCRWHGDDRRNRILPRSSPEPPPKAMTPSWPPAR